MITARLGHGLIRATLLAFLATPTVAQERTLVRSAPDAPPERVLPPQGLPENLTPHTLHGGIEGRAPEVESAVPDELTRSPEPGFPGDEFGQQPLPDWLLGDPYRLAFVGGEYAPGPDERVDPALLDTIRTSGGDGETYGFVMFEGRITTRSRQRVEATGVQLGNHHTFNCMTAVIPVKAVSELTRLDCVRWIGYAKRWQKIDPALLAAIEAATSDEPLRLFVKVFRSDMTSDARTVVVTEAGGTEQAAQLETFRTLPGGRFQRRFEELGAIVVDYHDDLELFALAAPQKVIPALADCDFVHFVELDQPIEPAHDRSTRQIGIDYVRSISTNDGRDTVVGMMDSGMDLTHVDVTSHWYAGWGYDGQSVYTDSTGHGTHVMGTISGTGAADLRYMGCAPMVGASNDRRIYVAGIFDGPSANSTTNNAINAFDRFATPVTINNVTTPIPSVINHSWGNGSSNMPAGGWPGTDSLSIALDFRVFNARQTHVVAAHNQGGSSYANQNYGTVLRPAVAKLALSVANCLDLEENGSYPGRIYFGSNKGPTGDGRLNPQIAAPGRWVRSVQAGTTNQYVSFQGTSMATPHVVGTIAGMHTHYTFMKQSPAVTRAVIAAAANPYEATRSWTQSSESYYNRQGMGILDAYESHYQRDEPGGFKAGRYYGTLTAASSGFSFDVDVPADADRTFFVLAFDEKPASQGAVRACIHDLDLHLDVEPFTAGFDTGEFHATRAWDTWEWYGNTGSISQVRGKTVRVKIHPRVRPTGNDVVRFGVAYSIPRGSISPTGLVSSSAPVTIVQPSDTFDFRAELSVPEFVQTNSLIELLLPGGFSATELAFVDRGNLPRLYTGGGTPLDWTIGLQGYWFGAAHRRLDWELRAPATEGQFPVCARLRSDNRGLLPFDCVQICVDGSNPFLVVNVLSSTHPKNAWSNSPTLQMTWNASADQGCAGLAGYSWLTSLGSAGTPSTTPNLGAAATQVSVPVTSSTQDRFFVIRAIDNAGNATNRTIYGPFKVDTIDPAVASVSIENGAVTTTNLTVAVALTAFDAHSGVAEMRHSMNGSTWSPWTAFSPGPHAVDMTMFGGDANEGVKTVRWQVRDVAGNVSATLSDSISYVRCPHLRQIVGSTTLENVTDGHFVVSGADLSDITGVSFGSFALTTTPTTWSNGRYEIVDDGTILVFPPQALPPGAYAISATSRVCTSNRLNVTLVTNASPTLGTPSSVTAGQAFPIFVARGGLSQQTVAGLVTSWSNQPSVAPGVVSLGIGQQFAALLIFPDNKLTDAVTHAASWTVPTVAAMQGTNLWFESFLVDLGSPTPLPAATTGPRNVAFF